MRHLDEGTVHAWLDRQVSDPQQVTWITAHLRECATCSARVAEEEAAIREADAVLGSVAPYADGSREAFEALVAGAALRNGTTERGTAGGGSKSGPSYPRWIVSAGLAAAVVLAIGVGWSARSWMPSRDALERPLASPAPRQIARIEALQSQPLDPGAQEPTPAETAPKASQPSEVAGRTAQKPPPALEGRGGSEASVDTAEAPDTTGQRPVEIETARSITSLLALVPSLQQPAAAPVPPVALPFRAESVDVTAEAPAVDVQNARQQMIVSGSPATAEAPVTFTASAPPSQFVPGPTAAAPAAGRGGGGRGGGRAAGPAPGNVGDAGQFAASADAGAAAAPGAGNGAIVGALPINAAERADGIDWLVVPRDAARARSGMALYGIAGLTPLRTMVNADASRVRTVYTVGTAEVVLLQEKQPPARDSTPNETVWSAVVGDVIITIRGTDAAALGARVRVD